MDSTCWIQITVMQYAFNKEIYVLDDNDQQGVFKTEMLIKNTQNNDQRTECL